ncbi:MAG: CvpA family protein [Desulfovibrionaceae bacterium]
MSLNYFDIAVLCILSMFSLRGLIRGFVAEVAGVVAIIGGLWYARRSFMMVADYLTFIPDPTWRQIVAYVLIFLAIMLLVGIIARILRKVLEFSFVAWVDKLAGALTGAFKGLVICSVLLILVQAFLPDATFVRDSRVIPYLTAVMEQVKSYLPPDIISKLHL